MRASPSSVAALAAGVRERGLLAVLDRDELRPGLLWVEGADAAAWLQGQLSNEVADLAPGAGNESARLARKGQLVDLLSCHRLPAAPAGEDHLLLLTDPGRAGALKDDLAGFHFAERLTLTDRTGEHDWFLLAGPEAAALMQEVFGPVPGTDGTHWATLPPQALRSLAGHAPHDRSLVFARGLAGAGFLVAVPKEAGLGAVLLERLAAPAAARGLLRAEGERLATLLELLRVEAGWPRTGVDFEPGQRLLPEFGLETRVVSWTKGCYLGQEIVARVRAHGSPRLALRGLVLPRESDLDSLPAPGSPLQDNAGATIGAWASRAWSPTLAAPVAMAYLDRDHRTPGRALALCVGDATLRAELRLLPFHREVADGARASYLYDQAVQVFAAGDDGRALALLDEALRLDPAHTEAWEAVGVILGRSGRYSEAIETFRHLEELAPDEPMVHTNLSLYYMRMGNIEAAERHKAQATMKRFGAMAGQAAAEELALVEGQRQREDAERRLSMFAEVLAFDAADPLALMGAGKALMELERDAEAEPYLARACAAQKDNSPVYALHGKVLERLDRRDEAMTVYERGIELAARKGDLMPLREMENRLLLLRAGA